MKNFTIFFEEKEGSTPLVQTLNKFEQVSIVHTSTDTGDIQFWEPFERHNSGVMTTHEVMECFDILFATQQPDLTRLNKIYLKTARREISPIKSNTAIGFKKRPMPPLQQITSEIEGNIFLKYLNLIQGKLQERHYLKEMIKTLKRNDVTVFCLVRQDILRWALSKYHGDGTGKPGHLQFDLARGRLNRAQMDKIHVNCRRLSKIIDQCRRSHLQKHQFISQISQAGLNVYPLFYEDFLNDKKNYFQDFFDAIETSVTEAEIEAAISRKGIFEKVHSSDISDFVENSEEVLEKFGDCFFAWPKSKLSSPKTSPSIL